MLTFETENQLKKYTQKLRHRLEDGEVCQVQKSNKTYIFQNNEWVEMKVKADSNIGLTMYELNEQLVAQLPDHKEEDIAVDKEKIDDFFRGTLSKYYMMLCKEQSYYTVFIRQEDWNNFESLGECVIDCLNNIECKIKSVENLDNKEVEMWITDSNNTIWCLHLFDYASGIVEFGG